MTARRVPHDLDAERALLGGMLLGVGPILAAMETVTAEDFYSPANRAVFAACTRLHAAGHPVETVGVRAELVRNGTLDLAGGDGAILDLQVACPSTSAAPRYAALIAGAAMMRRLVSASEMIADVAYSADEPGEAMERARAALDLVSAGPRETGLTVLDRGQLDTVPPPEWLIGGLITTGLTVVFGPPAAGKSFLALDWACSVATGRHWFGRSAQRRQVLYVAAEGVAGIPRRVRAWESDRNVRADDLAFVPHVVNLLQPVAVAALASEVASRGVGLLVVDTLARSMPGGDENAAQDMGRLVGSLTDIQHRSGCAVILVHHSGVERSRMRGSTSLLGAADTVVQVEGADGTIAVACRKQKDDDPWRPWSLQLKSAGESVVLTAAGAQQDDAYALLEQALSGGRSLPYLEMIRVSGGDGRIVLHLVEAGRLVPTAADPGRYRLASDADADDPVF